MIVRAHFVQGQKLICELTGKPASVVVNYFGIQYYYCDRQTLELDWNGIKHKIAQLLVPLRRPPAIIPSVEERERQEANVRKSKLALIDLCRWAEELKSSGSCAHAPTFALPYGAERKRASRSIDATASRQRRAERQIARTRPAAAGKALRFQRHFPAHIAREDCSSPGEDGGAAVAHARRRCAQHGGDQVPRPRRL